MEKQVCKIERTKTQLPQRKRVCAYARVSTGKDAMLHSLSAQVSYYSTFIQRNSEWIYVGVYADEAYTGTKDNRPEFKRLLEDCHAGNIDMVITKSISRFARNTVTLLETVRELKSIGVDVFFEEQNIHSMSGDGELMLTILASYAQEESLSVSENCKWRIRDRFKHGENACLRRLYGYDINKGTITVNQVQAEIVRSIFNDYASGIGVTEIARRLNEHGITTQNGGAWTQNRLYHMLKNEKYTGNSMLQKSYVKDHLSKRKCRNDGVLPMYYAEGTHKAIVSQELFDAVQERLNAQNIRKSTPQQHQFSGKIVCGICGAHYKRKRTKNSYCWSCMTYEKHGKTACGAKSVPEAVLIDFGAEQAESVTVMPDGTLLFHYSDDSVIEKTWEYKSRNGSWTDEMKAKAAENARRRWTCKQEQ